MWAARFCLGCFLHGGIHCVFTHVWNWELERLELPFSSDCRSWDGYMPARHPEWLRSLLGAPSQLYALFHRRS